MVEETVAAPASSELHKKIKRQVEYYFGDVNLPKDKFLLSLVKENDGWVPLETMLTFNRLKTLTSDFEVIISSLNDSTLIQISEDKLKIRRDPSLEIPDFNIERKKELAVRTVYCKGFPRDGTSLDDLLEYFSNTVGEIENIQMRKWYDKLDKEWKFKGSIFVLFPSEEKAEKFLQMEKVTYKDSEVIKKWINDYLEEKRLERKKSSKKDDDDENSEIGDDEASDDRAGGDNLEEEKLPLASTLYMTGMALESDLSREDLKAKILETYGDIEFAFIDFSRGETEAYIRFAEEGSAPKVFEKLGAETEIKGVKLNVKVLEGEEEEKYLKKALLAKSKMRGKHKMKGKGFQGRGRRGRRGRGGKRGGGRADNFHAKRARID